MACLESCLSHKTYSDWFCFLRLICWWKTQTSWFCNFITSCFERTLCTWISVPRNFMPLPQNFMVKGTGTQITLCIAQAYGTSLLLLASWNMCKNMSNISLLLCTSERAIKAWLIFWIPKEFKQHWFITTAVVHHRQYACTWQLMHAGDIAGQLLQCVSETAFLSCSIYEMGIITIYWCSKYWMLMFFI